MAIVKKTSINAQSFHDLKTDSASMVSGNCFISTTSDKANFIGGPLSISSPFTNIRSGGVYTFNSLLACTIPSNIITPVPVFEHNLPLKEVSGFVSITGMILSTAVG